ncbi:c-type cytochrome [Heliobacillus mobilis]|uniref:C-type cytochrome n=1 Tax=Heliobacterium mobile TaxID=28064 RepID=Q9ZGG5_HELMO|nr:cytochrome c [Heliobacterium mobile]AAC84014.1 cytochrome c553 PetJ [Heliobacterium mobile]MTV48480.1 c-type cytochrome [Heliobacterium mobile]
MKNFKLIGVAAVLGLSLVTLTACNGGSQAPAEKKETPAVKTEQAPAPAPKVETKTEAKTETKTADAGKGKELFNGKGACNSCHKIGSEGTAAIGPDLEKVGAKYDADKIAKILANPTGEGLQATMPPAAALSDDEKKEVAKFLASQK